MMSTETKQLAGERTQHTPGPWEPAEANDGATLEVRADRGSLIVAYCGMRSSRVANANARLIASAPELLEACKALLPQKEPVSALYMHERIRLAQVAVAKAEGQALERTTTPDRPGL